MPSGVYKRTKNLKDPSKHIVKYCLFCGHQFENYVSANQKYCSRKCAGKYPRNEEWCLKQGIARKGKKYPKIYKQKKDPTKWITKNCFLCGRQFESYIRHQRKYCSKTCCGKAPRSKQWSLKQSKIRKTKIGPKAANWKGGRRKHRGYILVYAPEHPFTTMRIYVKEHRLVMEKHLDRYLRPEEVVHHINRDKTDNRIENLQLFKNHSEHITFLNHRKKVI